MAEKQPQVDEREVHVKGMNFDTKSVASSQATANPFSDDNETASRASIDTITTQTADIARQAETSDRGTGSTAEADKAPLPSYSPLAFSNYPPLWTKDQRPKHGPRAASSPSSSGSHDRSQSGFSAATLTAVMSAGSKDDSRRKRFDESNPKSRHEHVVAPDRSTGSHGRMNIFGRDIGGLGKRPPSMSFRRQKGK